MLKKQHRFLNQKVDKVVVRLELSVVLEDKKAVERVVVYISRLIVWLMKLCFLSWLRESLGDLYNAIF